MERKTEAGNSTFSLKMKKSTTRECLVPLAPKFCNKSCGLTAAGKSPKSRRGELNLLTASRTASRKAVIISVGRSRRTRQEGSALERRAVGEYLIEAYVGCFVEGSHYRRRFRSFARHLADASVCAEFCLFYQQPHHLSQHQCVRKAASKQENYLWTQMNRLLGNTSSSQAFLKVKGKTKGQA